MRIRIRVMTLALLLVAWTGTAAAQESGQEDDAVLVKETSATPSASASEAPAKTAAKSWEMTINDNVKRFLKDPIETVFFFDLVFWDNSDTDSPSLDLATKDMGKSFAKALGDGKITVLGTEFAAKDVCNESTIANPDMVEVFETGTPDQLVVLCPGGKDGETNIVTLFVKGKEPRTKSASPPESTNRVEDKVLAGTVKKLSSTNLKVPIVVIWLIIGAIFFTIRMGFINIRGFGHAIQIVRGKYDNPDDVGEVTHFQALTAALSATVGLGNIGGVALAITTGGPGATFWMILAGFLGMASKFTECTLGQKYREVGPDGTILGGPMQYLSKGLAGLNWPKLGKFLAVFFAILCIGGSFAGGNAYQVNQSLEAISQKVTFLQGNGWVYGLIMSVLAGIVIVGGIKRIATIAETIVPLMCGIYVSACIYIIVANAGAVPAAFGSIIGGAFTLKAGFGGLLGVLIVGFTRSAFSNEAGVGSAAIAHSAAKSEYPVQEGIVALLEPFVDTIVVCTMSALVIVITGAYANPEWSHLSGAGLTSNAFGTEISWFPWVLSVAVALFAYSTMISWYYYGERCWVWLLGTKSINLFRAIFLTFSFLGSVLTGKVVMDLGDLMILGMAFPNILGVLMLSGIVRKELDVYWAKLKSGEIKPTKA